MTGAVHQLVPVLAQGDGVSAAVLRFRDLLRWRGYRSDVYADLVDRHMRRQAQPAWKLRSETTTDDVVIYHLSIGSPLAAEFAALPAKLVIFYQNVTPVESTAGSSPLLAHRLRWGRADLATLAPIAELGLAASEFSARELRAAGASDVAVVPLQPDLKSLRPRASSPAGRPVLLFVGRFAPHKHQDFLIRVLAALRGTRSADAALVLVGSAEVPEYIQALSAFAERLGVIAGLQLPRGPMSDRELGELYARATVFVCASDHEGFCLPLVEAMAFSLPVIGYNAGAVGETIADGGVVLDDLDPLLWAELAWQASIQGTVRSRLVRAARRRLDAFSDAVVADKLINALSRITSRD